MGRQGTTFTTRMIMNSLSEERRNIFDSFCGECNDRSYEKIEDIDKVLMFINLPVLNDEDRLSLSHYSGFSYFDLNRAIKNKWTYEENGTQERFNEFKKYAEDLQNTIANNQASIGNVKVYRGVPLKYFREYGINSLDELDSLKGQILVDQGFVSTSLVEDDCFYRKDPNNGINYNVMIEYSVPEEFTDGIVMVGESHFTGESEYLINAWSLAQVSDVVRDGDGVIIKALLVPKYIYDDYYAMQAGRVK